LYAISLKKWPFFVRLGLPDAPGETITPWVSAVL
jgi:hypothetical protein